MQYTRLYVCMCMYLLMHLHIYFFLRSEGRDEEGCSEDDKGKSLKNVFSV